MKVRIVNSGQPAYMTQITDAETGNSIDHVIQVDVVIDVNRSVPVAMLKVFLPVVDVIADAELKQICPCCGRPVEDVPPLQGIAEQVV